MSVPGRQAAPNEVLGNLTVQSLVLGDGKKFNLTLMLGQLFLPRQIKSPSMPHIGLLSCAQLAARLLRFPRYCQQPQGFRAKK